MVVSTEACPIRSWTVQMDAPTARCFGGSGLDLAISKQLVGLMDGEIGVSSVVGEGSEFWFTACFSAGQHPSPASAAPPPAAKPRWHGQHILIVEDNLINPKVACGFLRSFDLQVDVVDSGVRALSTILPSVTGFQRITWFTSSPLPAPGPIAGYLQSSR